MATCPNPRCKPCSATRAELASKLSGPLPTNDVEFVRLVQEACHVLDVLDADLAEAIGVSRPTFTRWRLGEVVPHPALWPAVFTVLHRYTVGPVDRGSFPALGPTFMQRAVSGQVTDLGAAIDEAVSDWHKGAGRAVYLHDHLGMTWDEYRQWVQDPDSLGALVEARRA